MKAPKKNQAELSLLVKVWERLTRHTGNPSQRRRKAGTNAAETSTCRLRRIGQAAAGILTHELPVSARMLPMPAAVTTGPPFIAFASVMGLLLYFIFLSLNLVSHL